MKIPNHKACSICNKDKPLADFATNKKGKHGRHSVCRYCRRIQQIEYRKSTNNAAEIKWRENNREKVRQYSRNFYARNIEKERARNSKRYRKLMLENPEKIRAWGRKWSKTNKGRFNSYRVQAKKRGHVFNITLDVFSKMIKQPCHYCGNIENIGIDRVNSKKGYINNNMVSCCYKCNYMKRDFSANDFINHCTKISKFKIPLPNEVEV